MNKNEMFHPSNGVRCFYVRDRHDNPVGLVMTRQTPNGPEMAWSLCKRKEDLFRKSEAKTVAYGRLAPMPKDAPFAMGLRDTPMNRALSLLSGDMSVPQTIRSGAKREVRRRVEDGLAKLPKGVQPCWGLDPNWPGNRQTQTVTVTPLPQPPLVDRIFNFIEKLTK